MQVLYSGNNADFKPLTDASGKQVQPISTVGERPWAVGTISYQDSIGQQHQRLVLMRAMVAPYGTMLPPTNGVPHREFRVLYKNLQGHLVHFPVSASADQNSFDSQTVSNKVIDQSGQQVDGCLFKGFKWATPEDYFESQARAERNGKAYAEQQKARDPHNNIAMLTDVLAKKLGAQAEQPAPAPAAAPAQSSEYRGRK